MAESLGGESSAAFRAVQVPRSLKHSISSRVGLSKVSADAPVPPGLARSLGRWLATGSLLVVSAPAESQKSALFASWLTTRAERSMWVEGSALHDRSDALDAALDGLSELGVITHAERTTFTRLAQATEGMQRENTPVMMVVNEAHLLTGFPRYPKLAAFAAQWPNVRFAFLTDTAEDPDIALIEGVTLLGAAELRDPLAELGDLSPSESSERADMVRAWAQQRDPSGGLFQLMRYLAQFLSVSRDSPELRLVDDLDAAIEELRDSRVIELAETDSGQVVMLVSEFREALDADAGIAPGPESVEFHLDAAGASEARGDRDGVVFHLARAGRSVDALVIFATRTILELTSRDHIDGVRNAASAIDIDDPGHSLAALALRLQVAMVPPLEPTHVRDAIQDALRRAQERESHPLDPAIEIGVTIGHSAALIARGRFDEARVLGRPLAELLLALPWLDRTAFGVAPTLSWTAQVTAELLEGNIDEASRFARVAHEAAESSNMPYSLYMATAALAAIAARRGELINAERELREAQRRYRKGGWPRSAAQTVEFVARFHLARAALDVEGMIELRLDISAVPDLSPSMIVLMKICECFVFLHSGQATQTRVSVRQLSDVVRDQQPGALFRTLGTEMTFEAYLRFGEGAAATVMLNSERELNPDAECLLPLLGAARIALGDGALALAATEECMALGSHHSPADHSLLLLVRAAAHQLVGEAELADSAFEEALLTQDTSPMPYLFLMVPITLREALWARVPESRQLAWTELRRFLATVPEGVGRSDETLPRERLTAREMEVLRAMSTGGTLEEIAVSQYVSRNTVKTHVRLIYKKLRVNSRAGAAEVMKRFGEQLVDHG